MSKEDKIKVIAVVIMLSAFPLIPDHYPWYYQVLLFNLGLVLLLSNKWKKIKRELRIIKTKMHKK